MPESTGDNDRAFGLDLAEILKDISSGEQAASMLEKQLCDLESKINSILDGAQKTGSGSDPQSLNEPRSDTPISNPTHSKSPSK
jgi:hypothetical protein